MNRAGRNSTYTDGEDAKALMYKHLAGHRYRPGLQILPTVLLSPGWRRLDDKGSWRKSSGSQML